MISWNEKTPFSAIKTKSPRSRKIDIFPKGLCQVLLQKWPFFQLFCLGNISQENVFYVILERKNAFLCYKNKKSKNLHFSKGVNPWFWSKNGHFCKFFFRQYRPGKCLLCYSRTYGFVPNLAFNLSIFLAI